MLSNGFQNNDKCIIDSILMVVPFLKAFPKTSGKLFFCVCACVHFSLPHLFGMLFPGTFSWLTIILATHSWYCVLSSFVHFKVF